MKTLRILGATAVSAATLALVTVTPAQAAEGDTTTTFALAGSSLSIAVQPTATLTNGASGAPSVSGRLGDVTVTDLRGGTANWSASATSTTFTSGSPATTTSTGVSYSTGAVTMTGTIVIAAQPGTSLSSTPAKVAGPTDVVGNNTASWNPTLTVALPSDALAGNYSGTVNTSVL